MHTPLEIYCLACTHVITFISTPKLDTCSNPMYLECHYMAALDLWGLSINHVTPKQGLESAPTWIY